MEIVLATDHAGFTLKEELKQYLVQNNITVLDVGTFSDEPIDYPAIIRKGCYEILEYKTLGIVIGGSGNGEAMAANKVPGIRCAVVYSEQTARLARAHNDANAMALGARICSFEQAKAWVDIFLHTPFEGGRHQRRIDDIESS